MVDNEKQTVRQYVLETGYPLANDWEFKVNSDGPQIKVKDDSLTYSVVDQSGYNVWATMHAKDEFSTSNGGCVLRFSVRCNEVRDASEVKFTLSGDVILRWNGSSFSYQSWSNGFTTLGSSNISPNSQWHTIVMVVTGDKVCLFEDGLERFRDKSTRVGEKVKPVFHMQALNRGSNLSFDLKDIFVMPGVSYVQGNSSWDYPMLDDMLPSSVVTYNERDGGGNFSFANYGFARFSSFPQIKHNMWGNLQVERKVPNGVFTYWIRVNSSGGSESKVQLPGNVILRLVNNGNSASWVTWTGNRFSPIGPSNIQAGQNDFTAVTLVFSASTVTVMEKGRIVGTLESMNRGDVSPSIGLQHLQSGTDVSIDIGGFRTVPSTKPPAAAAPLMAWYGTYHDSKSDMSLCIDFFNSVSIGKGGTVGETEVVSGWEYNAVLRTLKWKDGNIITFDVSASGEKKVKGTVNGASFHAKVPADPNYKIKFTVDQLSLISQAYGLYISQNDLEELANALPEFSRLMPTYSGRRVLSSGHTIGSVLGGIAGAIAVGTITLATGGADLVVIGLLGGTGALVGSQIGGMIGYSVDERNLQKIEGTVAQYDPSGVCVDSNGETYSVHFKPWVADWMNVQSYDPATVDGVGVLVGVELGALKGVLLKTRKNEYLNHTINEDGHYSWVFTPQSAIIYKWNAGKDLSNKNYIRHSTLFGGLPVVCAGEFYIDASTKSISHAIAKINDSSGHYQPDGGKCLGPVLEKLKALGLDIKYIKVTTV